MNTLLDIELQKYFWKHDFSSVCCIGSQESFSQFSLHSLHCILISAATDNKKVLFHYCVDFLLSQPNFCPQTLKILAYYVPSEYRNIIATFEPCSKNIITEDEAIATAAIRPISMFPREDLYIRFSNDRTFPSIETSIYSEPVDIVICCWELNSNAMGRAYVLAEMLARDKYRVLIIAPSKGPHGQSLWPPLSRSNFSFNIITFAYRNEEEFFHKALQLSRKIETDVVIASKIKPQSCLLTFLLGLHKNVSEFCDIDDYESAFYGNTQSMRCWKEAINVSDLVAFNDTTKQFDDERWINASSLMADCFHDYIFACKTMRDAYSMNSSPIVFHKRLPLNCKSTKPDYENTTYHLIFHGTLRKHKGIDKLLRFLSSECESGFQINLRLAEQPGLDELLQKYKSNQYLTIERIDDLSLDNLSSHLISSDLLCLLQDTESMIAEYQFPAKVSDAVVASLPILTTKTRTMLELSSSYGKIFFLEDYDNIKSAITKIISLNKKMPSKNIPNSFSLLENPLSRDYFSKFRNDSNRDNQKRVKICEWLNYRFGSKLDTNCLQESLANPSNIKERDVSAPVYDVVMLWKQHDTFEYMRRHNSLLTAMSRSSYFDQIIHWEPPISRQQLYDMSHANSKAWSDAYKRYQGRYDTDSVHYRTYIYSQKPVDFQQVQYRNLASFRQYFYRENYKYLSRSSTQLLWIYPPFFNFSLIHGSIEHFKVIVDFVDNLVLESDDPSVENYIETQSKFFIQKCDLCLVNCKGMYDLISNLGGKPLLVENGYPHRKSYQLPRVSSSDTTFVFIGNMNGRIDWDFVFDACCYYPQYSFKFYGASKININSTSLPENLSFYPPVSAEQAYAEILTPNTIGFFPFLNNKKAYFMNPIKFYEFRSLGLPVITSSRFNVPNVPGIFFANNTALLDIQLATILKQRQSGMTYRPSAKFYEDHSWDNRLNTIYSALTSGLNE